MKISIISLRDKIITLEVHSPSVYRQISSIFKTDEEGKILTDQIADEAYKSRLALSEVFGKKALAIKHELNSIPLDSKFIVIANHYTEDHIELYQLKGIVQELNGEENSIRPYQDRLRQISSKYSVRIFNGSGKTEYFREPDKSKRVCRFCHRSVPSISFSHKSHAISEALGYKSLVCNEECDECNERFSRTIEPDIVNMHSFLLSLCGISGKKGVRKTKGSNFKFWLDRSACQYNTQGTFFIQLDDLHIDDKADIKTELKNLPPFDTSSLKFIPQNIYKCLCKYAISCLSQDQMPYFQKTIEWINAPTAYQKLPTVACCSVNHTTSMFALFIRKEQDYKLPYCFASLNIANMCYMFIIPFSSQDRYSFTTKGKQLFFWDTVRSWFPAFNIQTMRLSSSKATHTVIKTTFTMEEGCKLGRDYFIIDNNRHLFPRFTGFVG